MVVTYTFNHSTREVETGRDIVEKREKYKVGGDRGLVFRLRFHRDRIACLVCVFLRGKN